MIEWRDDREERWRVERWIEERWREERWVRDLKVDPVKDNRRILMYHGIVYVLLLYI